MPSLQNGSFNSSTMMAMTPPTVFNIQILLQRNRQS
jgi:hypothetical protein